MESKLERLHIDLPVPSKQKSPQKQDDVVESWEDDDDLSSSSAASEDEVQTPTEAPGPSLKPVKSKDPALNPPPPTPISPKNGDGYIDWAPANVLGGGRPRPYSPPTSSTPRPVTDQDSKRPEKTTATAGRMIAASLGLKAPKKTEEQRKYERAVKEQEIKRRNREREEKEREREADEKAKADVWDS